MSKWGKLIKLAQKEENLGSFGGKVQKKMRKKSKFDKHMVFNNKRTVSNMSGLDFGPKKLSVHCTTIR